MRLDDAHSPIAVRRKSLPKSYAPGSQTAGSQLLIKLCNDVIDKLSGLSKLFALALLATGARPQELLNLTQGDIDARGFVLIKGLKGSRQRVVYCPSLKALTGQPQASEASPLFGSYTYAQFYRAFKNHCGSQGENTDRHLPVARLFRRAFARSNHALDSGDISCTADSLGHRAPSSTNFYLGEGGEVNGKDSRRNPRSHQWQGR